MLINSLQRLWCTSEVENFEIKERWTAVEQQRQNTEEQVSELEVCWCVCEHACLPAFLFVCLSVCLSVCKPVCLPDQLTESVRLFV